MIHCEVLDWEKSYMPQNTRVNRKILTLASFKDDLEMVRLLFQFGYKIDVNFPFANRGKSQFALRPITSKLGKINQAFFVQNRNTQLWFSKNSDTQNLQKLRFCKKTQF